MKEWLDILIGFEFVDNPELYTMCFMLVCWFVYLVFNLLYSLLGLNK